MPIEFHKAAAAYLREVEAERSTTDRKKILGLVSIRPVYINVDRFETAYVSDHEIAETVAVRNSRFSGTLPLVLVISIAVVLFIIPFQKWVNILFAGIGTVALAILFLKWGGLIAKRSVLELNADGIQVVKENCLIEWKQLARAEIKKIEDSESLNHYLLLHYYDDAQQCFRTKSLHIEKMNASAARICFLIRHFKALGKA